MFDRFKHVLYCSILILRTVFLAVQFLFHTVNCFLFFVFFERIMPYFAGTSDRNKL